MLGTSDIKLKIDTYFPLHFFFRHFFIKYAHWQCWREAGYLILLKSIIWPCCSKLSAHRTVRWSPDEAIFSVRAEIAAADRQVWNHKRDRTTRHQHRHQCGSQTSHELFSVFQSITEKEKFSEVRATEVKFGSCLQGAFYKSDQEKWQAGFNVWWVVGAGQHLESTLQKTYKGMESFESEGHEESGERKISSFSYTTEIL